MVAEAGPRVIYMLSTDARVCIATTDAILFMELLPAIMIIWNFTMYLYWCIMLYGNFHLNDENLKLFVFTMKLNPLYEIYGSSCDISMETHESHAWTITIWKLFASKF